MACADLAVLGAFDKASSSGVPPKVVYVHPHVERVQQTLQRWRKYLVPMALRGAPRLAVLTGMDSTADLRLFEGCDICLCTPMQFDMVTRRWKQRKSVRNISLVVADGIHHVGSSASVVQSVPDAGSFGSGGGPTYEVVLSRMRYIATNLERSIRIVGIGYSLANASDVSDWIGCSANSKSGSSSSSSVFNFGPNVRSVPLDVRVKGMDAANFEARLAAMTKPTYTALKKHIVEAVSADARTGLGGLDAEALASAAADADFGTAPRAIVFAPSKKHARAAALELLTAAAADGDSEMFLRGVEGPEFVQSFLAESAGDGSTKVDATHVHCLSNGVALLHEGMSPEAQKQSLDLFTSGVDGVLVTTVQSARSMSATASVIVVLGTQYHEPDLASQRMSSVSGDSTFSALSADYSLTDIFEMFDKASLRTVMPYTRSSGGGGRAAAYLFTSSSRKAYYSRFVADAIPVESSLDAVIHDVMNGEIAAGVVENKQDAVDYITWSLYYRRLRQNPNLYGLIGATPRHIRC